MRGRRNQEILQWQPRTKGCVTLGSRLPGYQDTQPPPSCDGIRLSLPHRQPDPAFSPAAFRARNP